MVRNNKNEMMIMRMPMPVTIGNANNIGNDTESDAVVNNSDE